MERSKHPLPTPNKTAVAKWLRQLDRDKLHDEGWIAINRQFHDLTKAVRPFINEKFETPEEQEAAFDGLTLGLMAMAHFKDLEIISELFGGGIDETVPSKPTDKQTKKGQTRKVEGP